MWQWGLVALMVAAVPAGDEADSAAQRAREALAERLQVAAEAIEMQEVEPAEWPDAALGCPEKGKVYAQVLTSGYRVRLDYEGRSHWLHVTGEHVVFCSASAGQEPRESLVRVMARATREARRDLAERLGIEEAAVEVERVRPAPEASDLEGCPPPLTDAPPDGQGQTLLLKLQARGVTHRYRWDGDRLRYCGKP